MTTPATTNQLRFEQAAYGSFPFRDGGYAMLAQSPGCRPGWVSAFVMACQNFGEPPRRGDQFDRALFSLKLPDDRVWMVVGVAPSGDDDRGRPGALGFHGLFVEEAEFRKARFHPFALGPALRHAWDSGATALESGTCEVESEPQPSPPDAEAGPILERLAKGRRVAIEAAGPVEALARSVWDGLPERDRRRMSVATFAFGNGNHFDLLAVPRKDAIEWDESYSEPSPPAPRRPIRWKPWLGSAAMLGSMLVMMMWWWSKDRPAPITPAVEPPIKKGSIRDSDRAETVAPAEAAAVARALVAMAGRFEVEIEGQQADPAAIMVRISDRLRYRGPMLSEEERSAIARDPSPGQARALAWDARVRRFADDRKLPEDFARYSLRGQLEAFARSFHCEWPDRIAPAEVPGVMARSLAIEEATSPSPLDSRFPTLIRYQRFLEKLPRRSALDEPARPGRDGTP